MCKHIMGIKLRVFYFSEFLKMLFMIFDGIRHSCIREQKSYRATIIHNSKTHHSWNYKMNG